MDKVGVSGGDIMSNACVLRGMSWTARSLIILPIIFINFYVVIIASGMEDFDKERDKVLAKVQKMEGQLGFTTDSRTAERLHLGIAELSFDRPIYDASKALDHLQHVGKFATDTAHLCNLLWRAAFNLQGSGFYADMRTPVYWERIKPAYERIIRLMPESDLARRAMYQLGKYYLFRRDYAGWRANRWEYIRRYGEKKPDYGFVAGLELGDSYLFEGHFNKAQREYEALLARMLHQKISKNLKAEAYLRLLQSSWMKSSSTPPLNVRAWHEGLEQALGFDELKEYELTPLRKWLEKLLEDNRQVAHNTPLAEWSTCDALLPSQFVAQFYRGMFDHIAFRRTNNLFEIFGKKRAIEKKVARVKSDMRTIAIALESYVVDWCWGYPPVKGGGLRILSASPAFTPSVFEGEKGATWEYPRRTIRYMEIIPLDPFGKNPGDQYYYYPDSNGFILISRGPDREFETDAEKEYNSAFSQPTPQLLLKAYDPTNGIISRGDIFRVKQ
jgi:hypothetical protein